MARQVKSESALSSMQTQTNNTETFEQSPKNTQNQEMAARDVLRRRKLSASKSSEEIIPLADVIGDTHFKVKNNALTSHKKKSSGIKNILLTQTPAGKVTHASVGVGFALLGLLVVLTPVLLPLLPVAVVVTPAITLTTIIVGAVIAAAALLYSGIMIIKAGLQLYNNAKVKAVGRDPAIKTSYAEIGMQTELNKQRGLEFDMNGENDEVDIKPKTPEQLAREARFEKIWNTVQETKDQIKLLADSVKNDEESVKSKTVFSLSLPQSEFAAIAKQTGFNKQPGLEFDMDDENAEGDIKPKTPEQLAREARFKSIRAKVQEEEKQKKLASTPADTGTEDIKLNTVPAYRRQSM